MGSARDGDCKGAGRVVPVIDRNRCEGKEDCVRVCPHDVFVMALLTDADKAGMSMLGRVKAWAHGNRQAYAVNAEACHTCGLCVTACPEKAIRLAPISPAAGP